jgi:hypothetical protein
VVTPNPGGTFGAYGHEYISAIPILGFRFKATRNVPLIEFVGDSITQGYADQATGDLVIGMDGMTGRMLRAVGVGSNASFNVVNFGQSGFTPEEYLARWKGLARADTNGATAMVYSIYSPNGFAGPGVLTQTRIDQMKQATQDAEAAAKSLGRTFIPAFVEVVCSISYVIYCEYFIIHLHSPLYIAWGCEILYWMLLFTFTFVYWYSGIWRKYIKHIDTLE